MPDRIGEVAYVVVQESLTNVLDTRATPVRVSVEWTRASDRLVLAVRDNGRGGEVQDEGMGISGCGRGVRAGWFAARRTASGWRLRGRAEFPL